MSFKSIKHILDHFWHNSCDRGMAEMNSFHLRIHLKSVLCGVFSFLCHFLSFTSPTLFQTDHQLSWAIAKRMGGFHCLWYLCWCFSRTSRDEFVKELRHWWFFSIHCITTLCCVTRVAAFRFHLSAGTMNNATNLQFIIKGQDFPQEHFLLLWGHTVW